MSKLCVAMAFDEDDFGELHTAEGPFEEKDEDEARYRAALLYGYHAGAIAWSRETNIKTGEHGPPTVLFQMGKVPPLE